MGELGGRHRTPGVVMLLVCREAAGRQRARADLEASKVPRGQFPEDVARQASCSSQHVFLEEATWWTVEVTASCCRVCLSPGCFSMNLFMKEEVGNGYTGRCGVSPDVHGGFIDIIVVPWHHPVTCLTQLVSSRAEPHV